MKNGHIMQVVCRVMRQLETEEQYHQHMQQIPYIVYQCGILNQIGDRTPPCFPPLVQEKDFDIVDRV